MSIRMITAAVTTDASGDDSVALGHVTGRFLQLRYIPDGTNPLATGADLDVVGDTTGVVLVNHDNIGVSAFERRYRAPTHDEAGAASLYAAAGEPVEDYIVVDENLTLTIANGGNTDSGTFYLWFEEVR